MSKTPRIILAIILTSLSLVMLISGCSGGSGGSATDEAVVGKKAPDFVLPNADGESVSLSDFNGSPILINFWHTGCPPCRNEMPHLEQVYSEMHGDGLVILAINVGESPGTVTQFLENNNLSPLLNTVLFDSNRAAVKKYRIQYYPTSFFVDRDGIIQEKVIGAFPSKEAIENRLGKIMS